MRGRWTKRLGRGAMIAAALALIGAAPAQRAERRYDLALVVAVDTSSSVDEARYRLQMEGIAEALEDREVIDAITGGPAGGILVTLVAWADRALTEIPWTPVADAADARRLAAAVRRLELHSGEFTCLGRMLRSVRTTTLAQLPAPVDRRVIDVSGDGIDNCVPTSVTEDERDQTVRAGATINGLPILVPGENDVVGTGAYRAPGFDWSRTRTEPHQVEGTTLDHWFDLHVVGGPGSFVLPARGYDDFGRAFRRKFVTEVSGTAIGRRTRAATAVLAPQTAR